MKLKIKLPAHNLWKRDSRAVTGKSKDGATPAKVSKEQESGDIEAAASTRPSMEILQASRFELYERDHQEVKDIRAIILGLSEGEKATQEDFDSSPTFQLRQAMDKTGTPAIIGEHWIDYLDREGHLATCKPSEFNYAEDWLPLYTRAAITKLVTGVSSLLNIQGDSPLVTVIPLEMLFQCDREYVIHQLHKAECLGCMSIYYEDNQQKQIAFCPYCGVMNENALTAYSHARKHLGITFLCGSCYSKLYRHPQHLSSHMKMCRPCVMGRSEKATTSHKAGKSKK